MENETLIIQPGINIIITWKAYGSNFNIYGGIEALGEKDEEISFIPEDDSISGWGGFQIYDGEKEVKFKNCTIIESVHLISQRNIIVCDCSFIGELNNIYIKNNNRNIDYVTISNVTYKDSNTISVHGGFNIDNVEKLIFENNYMYNNNRLLLQLIGENIQFNNNILKTGIVNGLIKTNQELKFNNNIIETYGATFTINNSGKMLKINNYSIESDYLKFVGNIEITNCMIHGNVILTREIEFQRNTIIGGVIFSDGIEFRNNDVTGVVLFNLIRQDGIIRDNYFNLTKIDYYVEEDQQSSYLDLRYNSWNQDGDIEDILRLDEMKENHPGFMVDFEPYYDRNGSLTDTDELPNGWEIRNGLDIHIDDTQEDPDGDGLTNLFEYLYLGNRHGLSMDPQSKDSDGDDLPDSWEIEYNLNATVYNRDDEGEEIFRYNRSRFKDRNIDTNEQDRYYGDGYSDPETFIYYGFTNYEEFLAGTDPLNCDTDGDGMEDGWEVHYGLNPLMNDSSMDKDGDGYSNLEEFREDTDPTDSNDHPREESIMFELVVLFSSILIILLVLGSIIFLITRSLKKRRIEMEEMRENNDRKINEEDG